MARKRTRRPQAVDDDGPPDTMTFPEVIEHLKRKIIAEHNPANAPEWWVAQNQLIIRMACACAGVYGIADPFVLGSRIDPENVYAARFLPESRARYGSLLAPEVLATLPELPAPAADHLSVVVVLAGAAHHFELPILFPAHPITATDFE